MSESVGGNEPRPVYEYRVVRADGVMISTGIDGFAVSPEYTAHWHDYHHPEFMPHRVERRLIGAWEDIPGE